jgi:MFS family permease
MGPPSVVWLLLVQFSGWYLRFLIVHRYNHVSPFVQIVFGYLSDRIGRKFGMMFATGIVALFSVLASASKGAGGSTTGMLSALIAFRFLLGIGVSIIRAFM